MDRYRRVSKLGLDLTAAPIGDNEIRMTTRGRMRNYITYVTTLFEEKGASEIVLKAMARVVTKAVTIAEIVKRRIAGLHQVTTIGSTHMTDVWQPLEEGLVPVETSRRISMITIVLSKRELDKSSPGYQSPIPADHVKPWVPEGDGSPRDGGGRGRGRRRGVQHRSGMSALAMASHVRKDRLGHGTPSEEFSGGNAGLGRSQGRSRGRGRLRGRGRNFGGRNFGPTASSGYITP